MIIQDDAREVKSNVERKDSSFKIKSSAKAFKILSDTLYSDKIGSIIRELSSNALDSHFAAGVIDTPIFIHLPTEYEPWFSIRDFGTGMSPEFLEENYSTYFESDKNDSNDFIGAYGLGSKSPFSYTDSFSVTSWWNRTKYIYQCFFNEYSIPTISLLHSEPSDENTGVEIKFSVDKSNFSQFKESTQLFFQFNKIPPICNIELDFPVFINLLEESSFTIIKGLRENIFMIGNIPYYGSSMNYSEERRLVEKIEDYSVKRFYESNHIIYHLPIGSVDLSASRESLAWTEKTLNIIAETIKEAKEKTVNYIQNEINKKKSYYEALIWINNTFPSFVSHSSQSHGVSECFQISWKNEILTNRFDLKEKLAGINTDLIKSEQIKYFTKGKHNWTLQKSYSFESIIDLSKTIIILNDKKRTLTALRKAVSNGIDLKGYEHFFVISESIPKFTKKFLGLTQKKASEIIDELHYKVYREVSVKRYKKIDLYSEKNRVQIKRSHAVSIDDLETRNVVFIVTKKINYSFYTNTTIDFLFNKGKLKNINLYVVEERETKTVRFNKFFEENKCRWINDYITTTVQNIIRRNKSLIKKSIYYYLIQKDIVNSTWMRFISKINLLEAGLNENSYIISIYKEGDKSFESENKIIKEIESIHQANLLNEMYEEVSKKIEKIKKEVYTRYPILHYLSYSYSSNENLIKYIADYITMMDKNNG